MKWSDIELKSWKKSIDVKNSVSVNPRSNRLIKNNSFLYKIVLKLKLLDHLI